MPRLVGQGPRGIPPLGLELPVGTVIAGKFIPPTRFRSTPPLPGAEQTATRKNQ
jgi:hypothetical protein